MPAYGETIRTTEGRVTAIPARRQFRNLDCTWPPLVGRSPTAIGDHAPTRRLLDPCHGYSGRPAQFLSPGAPLTPRARIARVLALDGPEC
jgi:hypothetical protein